MDQERLKQAAHFLLRVVAGFLFVLHGGMKLFDWLGGIPAAMGGHPRFLSQVWFAGFLEFYGGLAVLLGLGTRPAAFLLSGEMAVAYFQFHQPRGLWPIQNMGEPAVLYCFIYLLLAAWGGGPWSLDAVLCRKTDAARPAGER